jgi:hypothetical protein
VLRGPTPPGGSSAPEPDQAQTRGVGMDHPISPEHPRGLFKKVQNRPFRAVSHNDRLLALLPFTRVREAFADACDLLLGYAEP